MNFIVDCSNCPYIIEVEDITEVGDLCPDCGEWTLRVKGVGTLEDA